MSHDSSRPPLTDPRATLSGAHETESERTARYAREAREEGRATAGELVTLTDRVDVIEELVGRAPSALPGDRGSGLAQHIVDLTAAVGSLRESVDADRKARAAEVAALALRREPWARAWWIALGAVICAAAGAGSVAAIHWLSTLHH